MEYERVMCIEESCHTCWKFTASTSSSFSTSDRQSGA